MRYTNFFLSSVFLLIINNSYSQQSSEGNNVTDLKVKGSNNPDDTKRDMAEFLSVNYYKGAVNFNLPLYTAAEKNLTLPILLNYEGSGIKVDQVPTWIGLGFNLLAGGSITRNLRGNYDEKSIHGYINVKSFNGGQFNVNPLVYNSITSVFSSNTQLGNEDSKWACTGCETDSQPDEFILQLPGISTVFYLNKDGIPIGTTKFKITYTYDRSENYPQITAWQVITDDGVIYEFQQQERSNSLFTGITWRCHGGTSGIVPMRWYLTKIMSADNKNSIDLQYDGDGTSPDKRLRLFASEYYLKNTYYYPTSGSISQSGPVETYSYISGNSFSQPVYLAKISTSNLDVFFERDNSNSNFEEKKLTKISIENKAGETLKYFLFNYKDYLGLALDGVTPSSNGRFLLTSVQEMSEVNGQIEQIPPFKFSYDETPIAYGGDMALEVQICGVDHWGYYNGKKSPFKSRIPVGTISGLAPSFQGIGNRTPNANYMKAGSMTKITLPFGGNIQFEYEPHDYSYVSNGTVKSTKIIAGGLRIKRIINSDGVNTLNDVVRTFTYQSLHNSTLSSGVIDNEPIYNFQCTSQMAVGGYRPFSTEVWSDDPIAPIDIGYSSVIEKFNDNSYKVYNYYTSLEYPYTGFPEDLAYVTLAATYFARYDHQLFKGMGRYNYMRGLKAQETSYNSWGSIVERTKLSYVPLEIDRLFALERVTHGTLPVTNTVPFLFYLSRNYYVPVGKANLIKREKFVYDPEMDQDAISPILTETSLFEYNSLNWEIQKQTTYESNGDQIIDFFKYPLDYGTISAGAGGYVKGIKNLQDKNIISLPVEQYRVRQNGNGTNARVLSGQLKFFKDTQPYLDIIQNLEILSPLPFISASFSSSISGNLFTNNGNYKTEMTIDGYDSYGNVVSVLKRNQVKESYIWGYNNCLLIATAINAKASDIFYTSFEDAEGNSLMGDCKTGMKSKTDGYSKGLVNLTSGMSYYLTYFRKESGVWVFHKDPVSVGGSTYSISLSGQIDELRFYPQTSQMTSYAYDPAFGLTSSTDENNITTYYDYDALGRTKQRRDDEGNLEKQYSYFYKGN